MDSSNQHLLGGVRRAPMNQDEFDTKFNFLNERRTSRRKYSLDSIVEQPQAAASELCGGALICWRRAAQRSISIVARPPQVLAQNVHQKQSQQQKPSRQHISLASANSGSGGTGLPLPRYQLSNADEGLRGSRYRLSKHFPIIRVLQRYSFRKDLFGDMRAGVAVTLHATAEGLAMAFLAGLPPICGLYTTLCASMLYMLFGTSNFSFMGTNLVVCFVLRNILDRQVASGGDLAVADAAVGQQQMLETAATVTFLGAVIQALIYVLRLDFLFGFFSEQVLSGFSFGVGLRIVFNQLGNIVQLRSNRICASELSMKEASVAIASNSVPSSTSSFPCIIWAYYRRLNGQKRGGGGVAVAQSQSLQNFSLSILANGSAIHRNNLAKSNPAESMGNSCLPSIWECFDAINLNTLAVSIGCVFLLLFTRQLIGPLTRFRLRSAVSSEFLLVILASLLSRLLNAETRWHLEVVNFAANSSAGLLLMPHQLLLTTFPQLSLVGPLFADSLALAFLGFSLHLRSANSLSRAHKYKLDERQELLSLSLVQSLSAFMAAMPPGQSPLRISIAIRAGANTMLANLWLLLALVPLILWAPQLFQALPVCVLSCILLTAICPLFAGIARLPILWGISRLDVLTFCFAALAVLCSSNLCQAMLGSVLFGATTILVRAQWPHLQQLVNVTGSGAYYAERCYYGSDLLDDSGVSVIRFEAPILFHNVRYFKACVREAAAEIKGQLLGVGIGTRTGSMKSMKSTNAQVIAGSVHNKDSIQMRSTLLISGDFVPNYDNLLAGPNAETSAVNKVLIVDFSSVPYIDAQTISTMRELFDELAEKRCRLLFAAVNSTIRSWFKLSGGFEHVPKHYFFPSVHDAVLCAQQMGGLVAPSIHMSVSMNGCRDLITLSNAASNHDLLQSDAVTLAAAAISADQPSSSSLGPTTFTLGGGGGVSQSAGAAASSSSSAAGGVFSRPISSAAAGQPISADRETTPTISNVSTPAATVKAFCPALKPKQPLKKSNS